MAEQEPFEAAFSESRHGYLFTLLYYYSTKEYLGFEALRDFELTSSPLDRSVRVHQYRLCLLQIGGQTGNFFAIPIFNIITFQSTIQSTTTFTTSSLTFTAGRTTQTSAS